MAVNLNYDVWKYFENIAEDGVAVCKMCKMLLMNEPNILDEHVTEIHKPHSEVWNYFQNKFDETVGCKICSKHFRNIHHINNLVWHLKRHGIHISDVEPLEFEDNDIETVDLSHNEEGTIGSQVNDIETVDLSENDEGTIERQEPEIETVDLSQNDVGTIESQRPEDIIETIDLDENEIQIINEPIADVQPDDMEAIDEQRSDVVIVDDLQSDIQPVIGQEKTVTAPQNNADQMDVVVLDDLDTQPKNTNSEPKEKLSFLMNRKTLAGAVMGLVVNDGVAPKLFGSKNMQALLKPMCEAISKDQVELEINATQSEKAILRVAEHLHINFFNDLDCHLLSLLINVHLYQTSRTYSISVQFVNREKMTVCTLGEITLENSQYLSGDYVMNLLRRFKIETRQIVSAFWSKSKANYDLPVEDSDYLREVERFEKSFDMVVGDINVNRYIGDIPNLCIFDLIKVPNFYKSFIECRNIVKFINERPEIFQSEFIKNHVKIPQRDSPWMPGSTHTMMTNLHVACVIIETINFKQPDPNKYPFHLGDRLKRFIEYFTYTLAAISTTSKIILSQESRYGDFYEAWCKCEVITTNLISLHKRKKKKMFDNLIASESLKCIQKRSEEIRNQDYLRACLYLDPRFQHTLNEDEKKSAVDYLQHLWDRNKLYCPNLGDSFLEANDENPPQSDEFLDENEPLPCSKEIQKKLQELKLEAEEVEPNILAYWKKHETTHPEIYILSKICFAIPTTNNFWNTQRKTRNLNSSSHINPSIKNSIESIRLNQHLLENDFEDILNDLFTSEEKNENQSTILDSDDSLSTVSVDSEIES